MLFSHILAYAFLPVVLFVSLMVIFNPKMSLSSLFSEMTKTFILTHGNFKVHYVLFSLTRVCAFPASRFVYMVTFNFSRRIYASILTLEILRWVKFT